MKRILTLLFLALPLMATGQNAFEQETGSKLRFKPLDSWPYLYEDFMSGTVLSGKAGNESTFNYDKMNVNVLNGTLHYVEKGTIMQADMRNIYVARIGAETYLNAGGKMMKVLSETEHGAVVLKNEVDLDEMGKANIGYGKSAVASTQNVSLFAVAGGDTNKKSLEDVRNSRFSGTELPIRDKIYLVVDGLLIRASKSEVMSWPNADKEAVKAYLKANKVKWRDPSSLSALVEFLYSEKAKK